MELVYKHCYGSTPGASFASPYTGHPTEQGTQLSLLAFSLDVTQQVLHKYSVSTAGMQKCGLFLLYHPLPYPLPAPRKCPEGRVQGSIRTHPLVSPWQLQGVCSLLFRLCLRSWHCLPGERIFHSRPEVDTPHSSVLCRTAVWDTREARNGTGRMELEMSKQRAAPNGFLHYLTHSLSRNMMKEIKRRAQFFLKKANISCFRVRTLYVKNEWVEKYAMDLNNINETLNLHLSLCSIDLPGENFRICYRS